MKHFITWEDFQEVCLTIGHISGNVKVPKIGGRGLRAQSLKECIAQRGGFGEALIHDPSHLDFTRRVTKALENIGVFVLPPEP